MEISKKPWPILSVCGYRDRIDTSPDFQRPAVWSSSQKQLLIDTILRGYDIPKLYWRKTSKTPEMYEVVDGQQRLLTIFAFHAGEFALAKDADDIEGAVVSKLHYAELPEDLRLRFDNYALDVIVLTETSEDEVREMFFAVTERDELESARETQCHARQNAIVHKRPSFASILLALRLQKHEVYIRSDGSTDDGYRTQWRTMPCSRFEPKYDVRIAI